MTNIPPDVGDDEALHRRIHPSHVKPDGTPMSLAFLDPEMSVDRADYRTVDESLHEWREYGLAAFITLIARGLGREVVSARTLLNPAHALVRGPKSRSVARKLAGASNMVAQVPPQGDALQTELPSRDTVRDITL